MRDTLKQFHIRSCVRDALSRHGIAHDSALSAQLEANATIASDDNSRVIMKNGNALDVEIQNRLSSLRMDESISTPSRTVAKSDTDSLRKNFAAIVAGTVRVE
jgi:hypothetical protein